MSQDNKKILFDADVIGHFISSGNAAMLCRIFPNKKIVLKIVAEEVRRHPLLRDPLNQLMSSGELEQIPMPSSTAILLEFASLQHSNKGPGESACMAVARFDPNIIASNNWKDVKAYCELHQIAYLSTMDFIYEAYRSGLMQLADCDYMIYKLLTQKKPAKIPCTKLEEYCKKNGLKFPINFREQED